MKENERTSLETILTPFFPEAQSLLPFSILWVSLGVMTKEPRFRVDFLPFYWPVGM